MRGLIVGTGLLAQGLAREFHLTVGARPDARHVLEAAEPTMPLRGFLASFSEVPLVDLDDSLCSADIVILAIPSAAYPLFLRQHRSVVARPDGPILVDVTNPSKAGHSLAHAAEAENCDVRWVKAFSDNGALRLLETSPASKMQLHTAMTGNDDAAVQRVKLYAEEALGFTVKLAPLEAAREIERHQASLGKHWLVAAGVLFVVFCLTLLYAIFRYNVYKGKSTMRVSLLVNLPCLHRLPVLVVHCHAICRLN